MRSGADCTSNSASVVLPADEGLDYDATAGPLTYDLTKPSGGASEEKPPAAHATITSAGQDAASGARVEASDFWII